MVAFADKDATTALNAMQSFAAGTVTSYALDTNARWPNVTIPNFEMRGSTSNEISQALQMTLSPLVAAEDRVKWEAYANAHQEWLDESLEQAVDLGIDMYDGGVHSDMRAPISSSIQSLETFVGSIGQTYAVLDGEEVDLGYYAPIWQQSPFPHDPSIVNFDLLAHPVFRRLYRWILKTGRPVLSEVFDMEFLYKSAISDESKHPHSVLMQPVFPETFKYESGESMVAFMTMVLRWDTFFDNILPEGANGLIVVLSGSCGGVFSYQLNGPQVEFLGYEDNHDPNYDYLMVESDFISQINNEQQDVSDFKGYCDYTMRVYPSDAFKVSYTSKEPIGVAMVVVFSFVITAVLFAIFVYFVERRQRTVMETAKRTNDVVASLFPENVRARILKDTEEQIANGCKNGASGSINSKVQLKEFMNEEAEGNDIGNAYGSKPIADLFPEATVLFADIAGFTAWSSVREPCQVFTLLETVYHAL